MGVFREKCSSFSLGVRHTQPGKGVVDKGTRGEESWRGDIEARPSWRRKGLEGRWEKPRSFSRANGGGEVHGMMKRRPGPVRICRAVVTRAREGMVRIITTSQFLSTVYKTTQCITMSKRYSQRLEGWLACMSRELENETGEPNSDLFDFL